METTTRYKSITTPGRITLPQPARPRIGGRHLPSSLVIGGVIVLAVLLAALLAPHLTPYDMAKMNPADRLQSPSLVHPFGTDPMGRDLFSRVIFGARLSLTVAGLAVTIAGVPGILLGILAGMYPGWLENILSRVMDAWIAVPSLLLAIVMAATLGRSTLVIALALGLAGISTYYRQARAETLRARGMGYVEAARALGVRERCVIAHHILPNVLPPLLVLLAFRTGGMLMAVSALGFIGLGAPPPDPEWGTLIADGRNYIAQAWWLTAFPGAAITITVFGLNMLGDGLRDLLDPRCNG
ncbi:MAG: ABC transporter permease [Anaerolineae bacterium]|nr:ABC transporter permease [Anaerolineae bacterium]